MSITLEQYENIQNYLDGRMTPQGETDFLIQLENNILLKENFDFEKALRQNLASLLNKKNIFEKESDYNEGEKDFRDIDSIRSIIKRAGSEWERENNEILHPVSENVMDKKPRQLKTKDINLQSWIMLATAACIVIAIMALVWFLQKPSSPSLVKTNENPVTKKDSNNTIAKTAPIDTIQNINSQTHKVDFAALFKKYYAKDTVIPEMPGLLAMVPENYIKGDYSFLKINLDNLPNTRGSSEDLNSKQNILQLGHYYKGLSYIEINDQKKASENLQWVIDNATNKKIKIKAQWYLALIFLKNNGNQKAVPLLFSLSKNTTATPYNRKAKAILLATGAGQIRD